MRALPTIACSLAASGAFLATSCSWNTRAIPSPTAATHPPSIEASPLLAPSTAPRSFALTFTVDPKQTVGTIDTTLDPEGATLGPKQGRCRCPMRGTISARLIKHPDGYQRVQITDVSLATTTAAVLLYDWNILIGDIHTTIPAGNLKITDHKLTGPTPLDPNGHFLTSGNLFSVKCPSNIRGTGLVLKKAVGERKVSLDIPVTDAVQLSGSCSRKDQQLILKIPAAVLRDHFDIGEATIDLIFTADITATCPVPKS